MAKDIRECLLEQARKFHQWQEITYPGKTTEEIGGAWEVDYPAWNDIFDAFCHVLTQMNAEMADSVLLDEMVYLIARANEAEGFIQETTSHPQWFECLCRRAAASNESEAKWHSLPPIWNGPSAIWGSGPRNYPARRNLSKC